MQRVAHMRWEREQGRKDATEDMSEDMLGGEKGDVVGEAFTRDSPRKTNKCNSYHIEAWSDSNQEKKVYIVHIGLHGLFRGGKNMELGRDSDNGGQFPTYSPINEENIFLGDYGMWKLVRSFFSKKVTVEAFMEYPSITIDH